MKILNICVTQLHSILSKYQLKNKKIKYMFGLFQKTKAYEDLNASAFEQKIKEEKAVAIVDVRSAGEFNSGHLKGAVNIDVSGSSFTSKIEALDKSKTYLVYCRSGARSASASSVMAGKGLKVFNLAGGIMSWRGEVV